jgi:hypothetical protein
MQNRFVALAAEKIQLDETWAKRRQLCTTG